MTGRPALILHGGAGARRERDYTREIAHMGEVVAAMKARLDAGASALDVAVEATVTRVQGMLLLRYSTA